MTSFTPSSCLERCFCCRCFLRHCPHCCHYRRKSLRAKRLDCGAASNSKESPMKLIFGACWFIHFLIWNAHNKERVLKRKRWKRKNRQITTPIHYHRFLPYSDSIHPFFNFFFFFRFTLIRSLSILTRCSYGRHMCFTIFTPKAWYRGAPSWSKATNWRPSRGLEEVWWREPARRT